MVILEVTDDLVLPINLKLISSWGSFIYGYRQDIDGVPVPDRRLIGVILCLDNLYVTSH